MDQAQLERLSAELDRLLDLPAGQRNAGMAAIEDRELRSALERALGRMDQEGPLDRGLPELPDLDYGATGDDHLRPGEHLGPWCIGRPLGEGGMARVYLAERAIGPAQKVAIKLIRRELSSPRLRERFLREQQVVARLEHPGIARMVDAGVSESGEPWLATEYVDGESLLHWCTAQQLDIPARLRLFLRLLGAVQHAHQHLVVHRDIKPSNILVAADGQPKLLDFGIARALDEDAAASVTQTEFRVLTPDYAAPEQFTGDPVSTATDLYALGVVLYELLTGVRPRRPSARDGSVSITAPSQAVVVPGHLATGALRRNLRAQLRGDLDAIVLKALREAPAERYSSAEAFAGDVRSYLDGRPVQARRGDRWYRARKFVRRNRVAVAASAALVMTLAAGVGGVAWQARVARAEAARANALVQESQAQLDYLGSLLEVLAPSTPEARELDRGEMIAEATRRARTELAGNPRVLASVEMTLGDLADEVGEYAQAAALFEMAHTRRRQLFGDESAATAEALAKSGALLEKLEAPRMEEALRRLQAAVAVLRRQAPRSAQLAGALNQLVTALGNMDRYPQIDGPLQEALSLCEGEPVDAETCETIWLNAASYAQRLRQPMQAVPLLERAQAARSKRLGPEHARTLAVTGRLARVYADTGETARSAALLEQVHAANKRIYAQPNGESLRTLHSLGMVTASAGNAERGIALVREYIEKSRALHGENHQDTGLGYADLGNLLFQEARFAEAAENYASAVRVFSALESAKALAGANEGNHADALRELGRADEALPMAQRSLASVKQLFGEDNLRFAARLSNLARTQAALGRYEDALRNYDRSIELYSRLQAPGVPHAAFIAAFRANTLRLMGRSAEAEAGLRKHVADIDAAKGRTDRLYWEAHAFLVEAACANHAKDCPTLRRAAEAAMQRTQPHPIPGIARMRLSKALAAPRPG